MKIRAIHPDELDGVLAEILTLVKLLPQAPQWSRAAWLLALAPTSSLTRILLVATEQADSNEIVGFVVASLIAPQAELESIAVAAKAQRRGVARALLAALDEHLTAAEITELQLEVRASNLPALNLYQQAGFTKVGLRPRYYADPVEDALLLCRRLPANEGLSFHF